MLLAAIFIISRTLKEPKYPSTEKWIKKRWYIYSMEYYSAIKRSQIELFAEVWMDLENVIHSEVRKRKKYRLVMHIHGILKKNGIIYAPLDDPICKAGIETHRENCVYTNRKGVVVGRIGKLGLIHIQYCSVQFRCSVISNSL